MAQGVQKRLTQCGVGHKIPLDPLHPLIGDFCLHVFQVNDLDDPVDLIQQRAVDLVLIHQVGIRLKKADLRISAQQPLFGIVGKQQHGRVREIAVVDKMQALHEQFLRLVQRVRVDAAFFRRPMAKALHDAVIHILHGEPGEGHIIPCRAAPPQHKALQLRAGEHLCGAAAAVVIHALIGDGDGVGGNSDLDIVFAVGFSEIHVRDDPQRVADLVGQILNELPGVRQSDDFAMVIHTEV